MIRVSCYSPQRTNIQMKKANNPNFGNGVSPKTIEAFSKALGSNHPPKDRMLPLPTPSKPFGPDKTDRPAYLGGVPKGVINPEAYLTGPFYLD